MENKLFIIAMSEQDGYSYATDLGIISTKVEVITKLIEAPADPILALVSPYVADGLGDLVKKVSELPNVRLLDSTVVQGFINYAIELIKKTLYDFKSARWSVNFTRDLLNALSRNLSNIDKSHDLSFAISVGANMEVKFIPQNTYSAGFFILLENSIRNIVL